MAALRAQGVVICTAGGGDNGANTAELALLLMLAAARGLPRADAAIRAGGFQAGTLPGVELDGKVLGLIGLGRLGGRMAHYGAALGMRVIAWSRHLTPELAAAGGATCVPLEVLLEQADVVSLHMVLSASTRGLIGAPQLARMKKGAILVNTSRGPLIDEAALIAALRSGRLVAALDVYDREPLPPDHPLRTLPNTVLTPHLGYVTQATMGAFHRQGIENVLAFLRGAPIRVLAAEAP
jgi:phosphoglycerate dehydrogenase-like enzyme